MIHMYSFHTYSNKNKYTVRELNSYKFTLKRILINVIEVTDGTRDVRRSTRKPAFFEFD